MSTKDIPLNWGNPLKYNQLQNIPETPGLYIWVVGSPKNYRLNYVGQSKNIRKRFREHIMWLLGGGYCLYNADKLLGGKTILEYEPKQDASTFFNEYLTNTEKYQSLAFKNLKKFTFYCVELKGSLKLRESVESALIDKARTITDIENARVSRASYRASCIKIMSKFNKKETIISGITNPTRYGCK